MVKNFHMVTGAFGYTGKYIARRLLAEGRKVKTLSGHADTDKGALGEQVEAFSYDFDKPERLRKNLTGAKVLYNTYWIRFPRRGMTYEKAIRNTITLIEAAAEADVQKLVHISITNPCAAPNLPYFEGKCRLEKAIKQSGLSYAIIRPAVIFGFEDILINNIAWLLRKFPVFGIIGSGRYKIRPIHVEDVAKLAVAAANDPKNSVTDAVGPETFAFKDMVQLIKETIDSKAILLPFPPSLAYLASRAIGAAVRDVLLTSDEVAGLTAGLLHVDGSPTGETRLSEWLAQNAGKVGKRYASEIARHYRRSR
jgi:NADH dehydrogenase